MTIYFPPEGGVQLGEDVEDEFLRGYEARGGVKGDLLCEVARMFYVSGALHAAASIRENGAQECERPERKK
jgi:hypothetical protein